MQHHHKKVLKQVRKAIQIKSLIGIRVIANKYSSLFACCWLIVIGTLLACHILDVESTTFDIPNGSSRKQPRNLWIYSWIGVVIHYTITHGDTLRIRSRLLHRIAVVWAMGCRWPAQNIWHFSLMIARSHFVRIKTFKVFMTTQLSYVIGGDICIHQPGNTAFSDALVGDVAFDARAFRCFWEEFANLVFTQGSFLIPHWIFWLSFVIDSEEKRCFGVFHWIWSTFHKLFVKSYRTTFAVCCFCSGIICSLLAISIACFWPSFRLPN